MSKLLRETIRLILKEAEEVNASVGNLGFYTIEKENNKVGITYDISGVKSRLWSVENFTGSTFLKSLEVILYDSIVGVIAIGPPTNNCNDAYEVGAAGGAGSIVYGMGYYLSPTGRLMSDRGSVSDKAQTAWLNYYNKNPPKKSLDNIEFHKGSPPIYRDPFHDTHHTPDDTSDDCKTWRVGKGKVGSQAVANALNYSYEASDDIMKYKTKDFDQMKQNSKEFVGSLSIKHKFEPEMFGVVLKKMAERYFGVLYESGLN